MQQGNEMISAEGLGRPLRFAVMLDSTQLPQWQADCLGKLLMSGHADLHAILVKQAASYSATSTMADKVLRNPRLLWNAYNSRFLARRLPALQTTLLADLTPQAPILVEPLKQGKFGERIAPEIIAQLRALDLDFILRLGFGILKGEILECAKFGVWSFHHGDPEWVRGVPPGFWEVFEERPSTGVILQRLNEKLDAGQVLHRGYFATERHSYGATLQTILFASTHFPARVCAEIRASGVLPEVRTGRLAPVRYTPDNKTMLKFLSRQARRKAAVKRRYRWQRQQWNVALLPAPIAVCAGLLGREAQAEAFAQARWMDCAPGTFRADPFAIAKNDDAEELQVAFEHFDWNSHQGTIAVAATKDQGVTFGPSREVLNLATHLSYPFILESDGADLLVPENSEGKLIRAYSFTPGSHEAQPQFDIIKNCPLIDATFVRWQGRWYMFGVTDERSRNAELHIYHAEKLQGPWAPHLLNPVRCDVTSARPAGALFIHEDCLYRPAQDCAVEYGHRVVINRVIELSSTAYVEERIGECAPLPAWPYPKGMHTLSNAGQSTLIDAYRIEPIWRR